MIYDVVIVRKIDGKDKIVWKNTILAKDDADARLKASLKYLKGCSEEEVDLEIHVRPFDQPAYVPFQYPVYIPYYDWAWPYPYKITCYNSHPWSCSSQTVLEINT